MKKQLKGFLLIELLMIVVIITALGAIIIPAVCSSQSSAEESQRQERLKQNQVKHLNLTIIDDTTMIFTGGINQTNKVNRIYIGNGDSPLTIVAVDVKGAQVKIEGINTVIVKRITTTNR